MISLATISEIFSLIFENELLRPSETFNLRTRSPNRQELPKSMILMALLFGLHSKIFSGFKSQCMMLISGVDRNNSAVQS